MSEFDNMTNGFEAAGSGTAPAADHTVQQPVNNTYSAPQAAEIHAAPQSVTVPYTYSEPEQQPAAKAPAAASYTSVQASASAYGSEYASPYDHSAYTQPAKTETTAYTSPYTSQYTPSDFQPKKKTGKSGKRLALSVAAICSALVISGGSFYAGAVYNGSTNTAQTTTAATTTTVPGTATVTASGDDTTVSSTITEVVEQAMPSMVAINTITQSSMSAVNPFYYYMFGGDYNQTYETSASGSGIIIAQNDTELLIVTNNHVIDGADTIAVQFIDGESCDAKIKGTSSDNDLAVIAVDISAVKADTLSQIKVATLGNSDNLKLGEPAIAIGNSLGYGQSVTVGYISALNREVHISDRTMTLIQTDAAINPGNSGGALLNIKGEVIGINSAKYSDTSVEGTGYSIPISQAEPIINDLMNENYVSEDQQAYLGIYGQDVPESYQERYDWPKGVYISRVTPNSPAAIAGVQAGDIITSINGEATESMEALQKVLESCKAGDKVTLDVSRTQQDGSVKSGTLNATLIARGDADIDS